MTNSKSHGARRHHLVPQFYLRRFADEKDRIAQCRLGEPRNIHVTSIANAVVETDFYTVEEISGAKTDRAESHLAGIEGEAATGFRSLLDEGEWPLSPETRLRIATWIALQAVRGTKTRNTLDELLDVMMKTLIADGGKQGLKRLLEEFGDTESLQDLDGTWQLLSNFDEFKVKAHPNQHLVQIFDMLPGITRLMSARKWIYVHFEQKTLLTCDEPVVLIADTDPLMGAGLGTAPNILVPLSRRAGLWLGELQSDLTEGQQSRKDVQIPGTTFLANTFNDAVIGNARKAILTHPDDQHLLKGELPKLRTQEVTSIGLGTHLGNS
jgi:hypothetical protein